MGTVKVRLLQGTLPLCVLFGHPAHGSCGISNHIVSYPITNGHTHSNLLMNPGGKYGVPAEDLGEQNTVSGSSVWGRSPPVCPQALLSGVKTGTKPRGRGDTTHYMLVWKPHVPNRKQGRCPLVIRASFRVPMEVRHPCCRLWSPRELTGAASHQEFRIHLQLRIPQARSPNRENSYHALLGNRQQAFLLKVWGSEQNIYPGLIYP